MTVVTRHENESGGFLIMLKIIYNDSTGIVKVRGKIKGALLFRDGEM